MTVYLTFYGFTEKPFNATPDPRFLYITAGHRDALAQLRYGLAERKAFIVLTGPIGTGKTTLLNALQQQLGPGTATVFIPHTTLSFDGILEYMLEDLEISKGETSRAQRLIALHRFLIQRERTGQSTVLIVDEAQNFSPSTLEEIRLLSNFETAASTLLPIVLAGQPELDATLALPELRQLEQRIVLRCHISSLTVEETRVYIRTRLRIAGGRDPGLFTDGALALIGKHSEGIPRRINILCDHCLLFGYADQQRSIDERIVHQAARYLRPRHGMALWRTVAGAAARAARAVKLDRPSFALAQLARKVTAR